MKSFKNESSISAYPYIFWSSLFIVIPLLIVIFFGFTVKDGDSYRFTLDNFIKLMDPQYFVVFKNSIWLALKSTFICLLLGYPVAYIIANLKTSKKNIIIMLFIVPMWMNFLLRTYAWLPILGKNGFLNSFLGIFGIEPIQFLYTDATVLLGMVYNFLPFMVLPIYTVLSKMDKDIISAAADLGANKTQILTKIIFPLSIPGVVSGITMVFMPAVSTFVISRLLGGGQFMLLGNLIEQNFTTYGDWNFGSAISIFMMIIILICMAFMNKFDSQNNKEGGNPIW